MKSARASPFGNGPSETKRSPFPQETQALVNDGTPSLGGGSLYGASAQRVRASCEPGEAVAVHETLRGRSSAGTSIESSRPGTGSVPGGNEIVPMVMMGAEPPS